MNQHQIIIVKSRLCKRLIDGLAAAVIVFHLRRKFGGHKELLSGTDARRTHLSPTSLLIAVSPAYQNDGCPVYGFCRLLCCFIIADEPGAETELRDFLPIVKGKIFI